MVLQTLEVEFTKTGYTLSMNLAQQLEEAVLTDDLLTMQDLLWQWTAFSSHHGYALIIAPNGEVRASTFTDGIPKGLVAANLPSDGRVHIQKISDKDSHYLDFAAPLLEGTAGWLRLGFHEGAVLVPVLRILRVLLGMIFVFILLGFLGAVVFSRFFSSPIQKIVSKIGTVDLEGPRIELNIKTGDELELLAKSFEDMAQRLQDKHQQLSEANRKGFEAQKLAELGLLASGIAHELNNPVAGLKNGLKRIANNPSNIEQIDRYMPTMLESINQMEKVVHEILNYARPEPLCITSFDLEELVDHALLLTRHKLENLGIELYRNHSSSKVHVLADPHSITQVLVNLLSNAVDAMPGGGRLSISTRGQDEQVQCIIQDTGHGIIEKDLEKIWEPFCSTREIGKGTGLGLSVSRNLIEKNGGTIDVQSKKDNGTTFTFYLPVAPESSS